MDTITIRHAEARDQTDWDAYVEEKKITPYCQFSWQEAVKIAYGHQSYYLMAEKNNTLTGILPLIHLKVPFGQSCLVSLPYCDFGGIHAEDAKAGEKLLQKALHLQQQIKVKRLLIRCADELYPHLPINGLHYTVEQSKVSMRLTLPNTVDELWGGFRSKLRSQISKAEKNGLIFRWQEPHDLDGFYSVFSRNMHGLGSPVHSKKWLKAVIERYGKYAKLGVVVQENKVIGGGLLLCNSGSVVIPWASTLRECNYLNPNMLLYWNFLKFSVEINGRKFDFGRSTPGEGTYNFKKQWGAVEYPLFLHTISPIKREDKATNSSSEQKKKMAAAWRCLPQPIANIFGPLIRKYINL